MKRRLAKRSSKLRIQPHLSLYKRMRKQLMRSLERKRKMDKEEYSKFFCPLNDHNEDQVNSNILLKDLHGGV